MRHLNILEITDDENSFFSLVNTCKNQVLDFLRTFIDLKIKLHITKWTDCLNRFPKITDLIPQGTLFSEIGELKINFVKEKGFSYRNIVKKGF